MQKPVQVIKDQFEKFNSLLKDPKTITETVIVFNQTKQSRPDLLYHTSSVKHSCLDDSIDLLAEQRKANRLSYKFQLHCKEFYEKPFFRFDSDGPTHQNLHLPLREQAVTTPHFNTYDENGRPIAYKTSELIDIDTEEVSDINRFFQLFCGECSLKCNDDIYPNIMGGPVGEISFPGDNDDLLSNINFDV